MSVNRVNSSDGSLSPIATRGQFIQYSVMPTPSVDILNKIVQYIGTSTSNYTNGYFYKCIYDETVSPAIYRWDNVSVQAGGGGSAEIIKGYFNPSDNLFYEESTYVTPIAGDVNSLYLSLDTNLLYRYNGTIFVEVSNYEVGDGLNLDDNTLSADTVIFTGTSTEWNAVVDKSKYDIVNLTDEATGEVANVVEDGNLNPVTSNAVYDNFADLKDPINIPANSDLNDYINTGDYISVNTTNTATLLNVPTPVASAFLLMVRNIGGQNHQIKMQIIMNEGNEAVYLRSINLGIGLYREWKKINTVVIS